MPRVTCLMMNSISLLVGFAFLSLSCTAQDFQSWNEIDFKARLGSIEVLMPLLARVDSRLPNPQLAATGVEAEFHLPGHFRITGGYLFADLPQFPLAVHVPLIAMSKAFTWKKIRVDDRNRFERLIGFPNDPVRYRNRLLMDRPFGPGDAWHLLVGDEAFYNFSDSAWNQNRFQVGGGTRLGAQFALDLYYLQRNTSRPASTTHVLGSTLSITLKSR